MKIIIIILVTKTKWNLEDQINTLSVVNEQKLYEKKDSQRIFEKE